MTVGFRGVRCVLALVVALTTVMMVLAPPPAYAVVEPILVISPTAFDFGDVAVSTSAERVVQVTNPGPDPITIDMAGGGAGAFGGVQNCQGVELLAGESCQITYRFSPTALGEVTGSTSGTVNGQPFSFDFVGHGVHAFTMSATGLDFGDVPVGTSRQIPITMTNTSGATVTFDGTGGAAGAFGGVQNCQGRSMAPGESCQYTYTFSPSAPGEVTGSTSGTINGAPFSLSFRGNGIRAITLSGTSLDFGTVLVGTSRSLAITMTNTSGATVTFDGTGGAAGAFGGVQNCQGRSMAPGESCQYTYTFSPSAPGEVTGSTSGTINGAPFSLTFRGVGDAALPLDEPFLISPRAMDFGDVGVGASRYQVVTFTNVSDEPQLFDGTGGAAGAFGGVQNCQGGTMAPGESCQYTYRFSPTALGEVTGSTSGTVNGQPFSLDFVGNGVHAFTMSATGLDFGDVPVGTSRQIPITLTNTSGATVTFDGTGGAAGAFGGVQNCQGRSMAPGETCQYTYTFTPTALGELTGSTSGTINGAPFSLSFRGNGIRAIALSGTALDFGPVVQGSSRSLAITMTNTSGATVTFDGTGGAAGAFGGVQNCQGRSMAPGESCQYTYTFSPSAYGLMTGTTGGTINGAPFTLRFSGFGIGDSTPPTVTPSVAPPTPDGDGGWYVSDPTVSFDVTDPESAITATSGCSPSTVTTDGEHTLTCTATSYGGTTSASATVRRDVTPPVVTCPAPPTLVLGSADQVVAEVSDATSGPAAATTAAAADTTTIGAGSVEVTGADVAGNTTTVTCSYLVAPVIGDVVVPRDPVRSGSRVPVRTTLTDAAGDAVTGDVGTALADACQVVATLSSTPGVEVCATYDAATGEFVAVVTVPRNATGEQTATMTVRVDGTVLATDSSTFTAVRRR